MIQEKVFVSVNEISALSSGVVCSRHYEVSWSVSRANALGIRELSIADYETFVDVTKYKSRFSDLSAKFLPF